MDALKVYHALVVLLGVFFLSTQADSTGELFLDTAGGQVTGIETQVNGRTVEVFYGIPYAAPPVGDLRFKPPVAAPSWTTPRDGTVKPAACWQLDNTGLSGSLEQLNIWKSTTGVSEDCLYVNVWRPQDRSGPKKIMVWIHGGGFWAGSAVLDANAGSQLAARQDIILVTIAYRLGVPGFLLTSSQENGNMGIFDQRMALEWVRDNAAYLGGSKDHITIFGEDAGATSVGFHLMTPNDLFTNAIMQSGSPLAQSAIMNRNTAIERSLEAIESLGCNGTDDKFSPCVNGLSVEDLSKKFLEGELGLFELPLGPYIDTKIVVNDPEETLEETDDIKLTDVFIGVNKDEGVLAYLYAFGNRLLTQGKIRSLRDFRDMMLQVANDDADLRKILLREYIRDDKTKNRRRGILTAAIGDDLVKCSVLDFARKYTKRGGRVYLYSFEDQYSFNTWPEWMGVPRGAEVEIVFGAPLEQSSGISDEERFRIQDIMTRWAMFAKTGNPSGYGVDWPKFTLENQEYVRFDQSGLTHASGFRNDECSAWQGKFIVHSDTKSKKSAPEPAKPAAWTNTAQDLNLERSQPAAASDSSTDSSSETPTFDLSSDDDFPALG